MHPFCIPVVISIHAPREGSDYIKLGWDVYCTISIHAPREGSDFSLAGGIIMSVEFQSTLPVRGATAKMHKKSMHS